MKYLLFFIPLLAVAAPNKTCTIKYRKGDVAKVAVPKGAASTLKFPDDVAFAHIGSSSDYSVAKAEGFKDVLIVSPTRSNSRETSLTVMVGKKGNSFVSLWLRPVSSNLGCTVVEVKRGL
ncbi:MAG: hypothetical protein R3C42_09985 [Parvularculaceae bacterium]